MDDSKDKQRIFNDRKPISVPELRRRRAAAERRGPLSDADLLSLAKDTYGFTPVVPIDPQTLNFKPEVRAWCTPEKCTRCGKTWTCPPACGPIDEIEPKIRKFSRGWLLVNEAKLQSNKDYEGMHRGGQEHKISVMNFYADLLGTYPDAVPLSAGSCSFCKACTYPNAPCRFPDFAYPSMEACGLLVSEVCTQNGLDFYTGNDNTMSFVSCILLA